MAAKVRIAYLRTEAGAHPVTFDPPATIHEAEAWARETADGDFIHSCTFTMTDGTARRMER